MKKFAVITLAVLLLLTCFAGCTVHTSMSYVFKIDNGDKISIKLDTTDGYFLTSDVPFDISMDDKVISTGTFVQGYAYDQYVDSVKNDDNAEVLDSGVKDGNKYFFWNYNDSEFNYVIYVGDSNTAVILGNPISEEAAREVFDLLTISVKD